MIRKVQRAGQMWGYFGPAWLAYRASYAARSGLGLIERQIPATRWTEQSLAGALSNSRLSDPDAYLAYRRTEAPAFFFVPTDRVQYHPYFTGWDIGNQQPLKLADALAQGTLSYFEHTPAQIGFPPDWFANPFTGQRRPATQHWSRIDDFDSGDIKVIWEPSRFGFTYLLVRAYWRSGDERYVEWFWQLVEDWRSQNAPQWGPNWKCGQETSFRVMAWCFGLYGFLAASATTPTRVAMLAQMIAVSGHRIEANLSYALSQRNNHSISEGLGLWTIGTLFPEFREALRWRDKGRRVLETLGRELIYDDGSFVQHSMNYHRLMLHDFVWTLRLGDLNNQPFSVELKTLVTQAGAFLYQIHDAESGKVPNYGSNDGALILPLDNCDYQDYRPVLQATHYLGQRTRCFGDGPWDEDLLWLFGPESLKAPVLGPALTDFQAPVGGYYTLRTESGFAFVRCATFRHRPNQADMLHVDLWWRGQNLALDPGTYSYNAPEPWNNALAHTAYHNTVTVDGLDQMEQVGKFLWLPWLHSTVRLQQRSQLGQLAYWEGEHDGYRRLPAPVTHRRGILRLGDENWLIVDALSSSGAHTYRLHWLLPDLPHEWDASKGHLTLDTPVGAYHMQMAAVSGRGTYSLVRADTESPRGWRAPYYNSRTPALSADLTVLRSAPASEGDTLLFWTWFGPEPCHILVDGTTLQIEAKQWRASVHLQPDNPEALIGDECAFC